MNLQYDQLVEGILGDLAMKGLKGAAAAGISTAKSAGKVVKKLTPYALGAAAAGISTAAGLGPQGLYGGVSKAVSPLFKDQELKLKNKKLTDIKNPTIRAFYKEIVNVPPSENGIVGLSSNTNAFDAMELTEVWLKSIAKLKLNLDGLTSDQAKQKLGTVRLQQILDSLPAAKHGTVIFKNLITKLGVSTTMTLDSFIQTLSILLQDNPTV